MTAGVVFKFAVRVLSDVAKECCGVGWCTIVGYRLQFRIRPIFASLNRQLKLSAGLSMDKVVVMADQHGIRPRLRFRWHPTLQFATGVSSAARSCCWKVWAEASPGALCSSSSRKRKTMAFAFVFPGQGSQSVGMMSMAMLPSCVRRLMRRPRHWPGSSALCCRRTGRIARTDGQYSTIDVDCRNCDLSLVAGKRRQTAGRGCRA